MVLALKQVMSIWKNGLRQETQKETHKSVIKPFSKAVGIILNMKRVFNETLQVKEGRFVGKAKRNLKKYETESILFNKKV